MRSSNPLSARNPVTIVIFAIVVALFAYWSIAGSPTRRQAIDEFFHPGLAEQHKAERRANAEQLVAMLRTRDAYAKCGVHPPSAPAFEDSAKRKAEGRWPKFTPEQSKCLADNGVARDAGAFIE